MPSGTPNVMESKQPNATWPGAKCASASACWTWWNASWYGGGNLDTFEVRSMNRASLADRAAVERIPRGASQAPPHVAQPLLPLREVGELQAPALQLRLHAAHLPERLMELLVPGQQLQQRAQLVVVGRVDDVQGEDFGVRRAVLLLGLHQEGGALPGEDVRAREQWAHGAEPDGGPVVQRRHQPRHVHAPLQLDEFGGRGAGEEGREERLICQRRSRASAPPGPGRRRWGLRQDRSRRCRPGVAVPWRSP